MATSSNKLILSLYRGILRTARAADDNKLLMQELLRRPVDVIQAAGAGLDTRALNIRVVFEEDNPSEIAGTERYLPRRHVVRIDSGAVRSGPVVAKHPDYGRDLCGGDLFWDANITVSNPRDGSLKLDFADGDSCVWSAEEASLNVHQKHFFLSDISDSNGKVEDDAGVESSNPKVTQVLAVGGFYVTSHNSKWYPKWYRASLLNLPIVSQQSIPDDASSWSLVDFCRAAFRQAGTAPSKGAVSNLSFERDTGSTIWGVPSVPQVNSNSACVDKAFEVLTALGVTESSVRDATMGITMGTMHRYSSPQRDDSHEQRAQRRRQRWAASATGAFDSLMTRSSQKADIAEVLAANGAFFAALEAQSMPLMRFVWASGDENLPEPSCIHPGHPLQYGWSEIESFWAGAFQRHPNSGHVVVGGGDQSNSIRNSSMDNLKLELDNVKVTIDTEKSARVTLTARVSRGSGDSSRTSSMVTTNIFVRSSVSDRYRLIHHHSSLLLGQ